MLVISKQRNGISRGEMQSVETQTQSKAKWSASSINSNYFLVIIDPNKLLRLISVHAVRACLCVSISFGLDIHYSASNQRAIQIEYIDLFALLVRSLVRSFIFPFPFRS